MALLVRGDKLMTRDTAHDIEDARIADIATRGGELIADHAFASGGVGIRAGVMVAISAVGMTAVSEHGEGGDAGQHESEHD
jgi:hypothetical protein